MKSNKIFAIVAAAMLLGTGSLAFAAQGGSHGSGGNAGGASGSHMSSKGDLNTNGPEATDKDKGRLRAVDRHLAHQSKHHHKHQKPKHHKPVKPTTQG